MAERPYRIFISGNCQAQFVFDSLRILCRDNPDVALSFRATYRPPRDGDDEAARHCDFHLAQIANLERDPWRELVPANVPRLRFPVLLLTGVFHALAPRVHPYDPSRGRPPFYLARGNKLLSDYAARFHRGENADSLLDAYLRESFASAPRLLELNIDSMRRVAKNSDLDPWRDIEPRLTRERFFWSVKHPTLAMSMRLLRPIAAALNIPFDPARLDGIAAGPEYHEPYHAPIHPRLAETLGLTWAGPETRYRFFHRWFTAAEHARRHIAGDFADEFAINRAIRDARSREDERATARLFRAAGPRSTHGQAEFWYARVLHRQGKLAPAITNYERARDAIRAAPHPVPHRADIDAAKAETYLDQAQRVARRAEDREIAKMKCELGRLEAEEAYLAGRIRWWMARHRLAALRAEG